MRASSSCRASTCRASRRCGRNYLEGRLSRSANLAESIHVRFSWLVLAACTNGPVEPTPDAPAAPEQPWATYTIAPGDHTATVERPELKNPIDGVTDVAGRDFELVLDASAMYVLTEQPADQFDWNKLPGLSDCSTCGAMFGWRWRVDAVPPVLEVAAYANNDGAPDERRHGAVHPRRQRSRGRGAVARPRLARADALPVRGVRRDPRAGHRRLREPRRCTETPTASLAWAGAVYFGGAAADHREDSRASVRGITSATARTVEATVIAALAGPDDRSD